MVEQSREHKESLYESGYRRKESHDSEKENHDKESQCRVSDMSRERCRLVSVPIHGRTAREAAERESLERSGSSRKKIRREISKVDKSAY